MTLEAIQFSSTQSRPKLKILNQLLLPHKTTYVQIHGARAAFGAIRNMLVRGAPAIALVAALSVAVEDPFGPPLGSPPPPDSPSSNSAEDDAAAEQAAVDAAALLEDSAPPLPSPEVLDRHTCTAADVAEWYAARLVYLMESRPTAVNLSDAARKLTDEVRRVAAAHGDEEGGAQYVRTVYREKAQKMLVMDLEDNRRIAMNGSQWLAERAQLSTSRKGTVVTICNTGALATAGIGTALGVIHALHDLGILHRVYYSETRPYNQGSRLTGYELLHDEVPATLITDSMAAALFRLKAASENIIAVIVGADRVAANGDTANKIGTYSLAVLARHHGVKFLVAAPLTTVDLRTASGADIVIEERPQHEVLAVQGPTVTGYKDGKQTVDIERTVTVSTAAPGTKAWNPAFDVTPAELIDGIITEGGVAEKRDGKFELAELFQPGRSQENGT